MFYTQIQIQSVKTFFGYLCVAYYDMHGFSTYLTLIITKYVYFQSKQLSLKAEYVMQMSFKVYHYEKHFYVSNLISVCVIMMMIDDGD